MRSSTEQLCQACEDASGGECSKHAPAAFHRRLEITYGALLAIRVDQHGTPNAKLPNCPRCDEDELYAAGDETYRCYLCNWSCRWLAVTAPVELH